LASDYYPFSTKEEAQIKSIMKKFSLAKNLAKKISLLEIYPKKISLPIEEGL
jgi:hypothetical protein